MLAEEMKRRELRKSKERIDLGLLRERSKGDADNFKPENFNISDNFRPRILIKMSGEGSGIERKVVIWVLDILGFKCKRAIWIKCLKGN